MKLLPVSSLIFLLFSGEVLAHGIAERSMHPREIAARQLEANKRHIQARSCANEINEYHRKRKMAKRHLLNEKRGTEFPYSSAAVQPQETSIRNTTCVTAPEVTEGPYYLNNDLVRQDLTESQGGVPLELDIGIIDTSNCQPLSNVLVELWHCNATGHYSGFTTSTAGFGAPPGGGSGSASFSLPSGVPMPSDGNPPPSPMTDNLNFLRGGWQSNDAGIVAFKTIYPGYYDGRAIHIHTMIHQNITYNSNGTYTSRSGSLVHVGQMFFEDTFSDKIMAISPYKDTTMNRTYNTQDSILAQENSNGYSAYVDAAFVDENNIQNGVVGFITIGVNSQAHYNVSSYNYYLTGELVQPVSTDSTGGVITATGTASTGDAAGRRSGVDWPQTIFAAFGLSLLSMW
ncbi:aromatic compound dioxygenase [Serendipita vermifera]|nr:aromatic compound dioxygenase [Serendipita vermifera]